MTDNFHMDDLSSPDLPETTFERFPVSWSPKIVREGTIFRSQCVPLKPCNQGEKVLPYTPSDGMANRKIPKRLFGRMGDIR